MNFNTNNLGHKDDQDKLRLDLIEPEFIEGIGNVLTKGAQKYSENSWQNVENAENRYYAAAMRLLMAWRKGDVYDAETDINHLLHAACNLMFLFHFDREENK